MAYCVRARGSFREGEGSCSRNRKVPFFKRAPPAPTLPSVDTFSLSGPQQSGPEARGLSPSTHVSSRLALLLHLVSHYSLE